MGARNFFSFLLVTAPYLGIMQYSFLIPLVVVVAAGDIRGSQHLSQDTFEKNNPTDFHVHSIRRASATTTSRQLQRELKFFSSEITTREKREQDEYKFENLAAVLNADVAVAATANDTLTSNNNNDNNNTSAEFNEPLPTSFINVTVIANSPPPTGDNKTLSTDTAAAITTTTTTTTASSTINAATKSATVKKSIEGFWHNTNKDYDDDDDDNNNNIVMNHPELFNRTTSNSVRIPPEQDPPAYWPMAVLVIFLVVAIVLCSATAIQNCQKRKGYTSVLSN